MREPAHFCSMAYARILVATDLSDSALAAARFGALLAAGSIVRLVTVVPFPELPGNVRGTVLDQAMDAARTREAELERTLRTWGERAGIGKPEVAIRYGNVVRELLHEASEFGADLLVMGSRGMSRLEHLLLGSVARGVTRNAQSDVLIVRGDVPARPAIRRIMVATDFYGPSKAAGRRAASLAREAGAELVAYHAIDPNLWAGVMHEGMGVGGRGVDKGWVEKTMGENLHVYNVETLGGKATERLGHGKSAQEVSRAAKEMQVDLVVTGTHGSGPIARALLGSVAESIVEQAPCSVLVVRR